MERRKVVASMLLLTVLGFIFLVPPTVHLFNHEAAVMGVPQIVGYLFVVWLLLIVGTAVLTRLLKPDRIEGPDEGES